MSILSLFSISVGAILTENFVFVQLLGICPFLTGSKKMPAAVGMGAAVTLVMMLTSAISYLLDTYVLKTLGLEYMQTVVFVLVIALIAQLIKVFSKKYIPAIHKEFSSAIPLVAANCAVLGVLVLNSQNGFNFIQSVVYAAAAGIGFLAAISLFAAVRERVEYSDVPVGLKGMPITLIAAGLVALAFMGFSGMKIF